MSERTIKIWDSDYIIFEDADSLLGNYATTPFKRNGYEFKSVYQMVCFEQAKHWGDFSAAFRILDAETPHACKLIKNNIKKNDPFESDLSTEIKLFPTALMYKFTKNKDAKTVLVKTGNKRLVYASSEDPYWGSGYEFTDLSNTNPDFYTHGNRLGNLLMMTRSEILDPRKVANVFFV